MAEKGHRIIYLIGLVLLLAFCKKEDTFHHPPKIVFSFSPEKGLTTTVFNFDFSRSIIDKPDQNKMFFRWDWNNDGIWDTPYTNKTQFEHRYLIAGKNLTKVITMDLNGLSDTAQFEIEVGQGYSKPKPHLVITPTYGTPYTQFILDASGTKDDEDSIQTLRFRWDLNGDGEFDTGFSASSIYYHHFNTFGSIRPIVEVMDTMGLTDKVAGRVEITIWDTTIVADFNWTSRFPVTGDTIVFDGGLSHDSIYPDQAMKFKWDWENDRIFDTEFSDNPEAEHVFKSETRQSVRLQVKNYLGLINEVVKEVQINHKNLPPVAIFEASSIGGNPHTRIRFDYWDSRDLETSPSQLLARWDWNGDGVWDTDFSNTIEVYHVFPDPGIYPVQLNIMDAGGLSDIVSKTIYIGNGTNDTDILLDKRGTGGYEYYGIVKIGDQWWFARNLQVQDGRFYNQSYYDQNWSVFPDYGCLYPIVTMRPLCPEGWRIPTKEDWNQLFSQFDASTLYEDLLPGGKSGFNIVLGGMIKNDVDPISYTGKGFYGHYWSQTKLSAQGGQSHWIVTFDNIKQRVLPGYNSSYNLYSVRCVKDAH